jgi:hypothetical protein
MADEPEMTGSGPLQNFGEKLPLVKPAENSLERLHQVHPKRPRHHDLLPDSAPIRK